MLGAVMTNVLYQMTKEVCPKCKNKKHNGDCWKCGKCGKLGHKTAACRCLDKKDVTCFNCNEKGHLKRDCPTLKKNGQGGNNRGAVYKLGVYGCSHESVRCTLNILNHSFPIDLVGNRSGSFDIIIGMAIGYQRCGAIFCGGEKGVVQATARVVRETFYSTELVTVGSSGVVREEERWMVPNVHRITREL
ncbi:putative reverse transcriptase domain-containing protein [Tanacetum coccineum]